MSVTATCEHTAVATLPDEPGAEINKAQWNGTSAHSVVLTGLGSAAEAATTDFDAAGTATAAVAAHVAAPNPHPQYLTPAEGDAAYQPLDIDLTAIAALVSAADKFPYATGSGTWSLTDLSSFARTILDDANGPAVRATIGAGTSNFDGVYSSLTGIPSTFAPSAHATSHQDGGADEINVAGLSGLLADAQKVTVRKNSGADVGTRKRLNFVEGTNVTLTVADDAGGDEVDVTVAASLAGGGVTYTEVTQDLGVARSSGTFDITGLSGLTADKLVNIVVR